MKKDYDLLLPKTSYGEQGNFKELQEQIIKTWNTISLKAKIKGRWQNSSKSFIIHLGPPYATGDLHKGHLLNYILKDFTIRSRNNLGYKVEAIQGWDCHGLPIEMKVEAQYKLNQAKDCTNQEKDNNSGKIQKSVEEFREDCKNFAQHWITEQRQSLEKLGFSGEFDTYYTTMDLNSQISIIKGFFHLLKHGWISRRKKTTMWSTVEHTTLSEAEINYQDKHNSTAVYFLSPLTKVPKMKALEGHFITVWTTTPWTLPGNNAYAYNTALNYQLVKIGIFTFIVEQELRDTVVNKILQYHNIQTDNHPTVLFTFKGDQLEGAYAQHPIYNFEVPLFHGDFVGEVDEKGNVTGGKGTGLVHIAGAHGIEDFNLSVSHNLSFYDYLDQEGYYTPEVPGKFAGLHALKEQERVIEALGTKLLVREKYQHRYPYSERGKNPIIFKLTAQWFIDIDNSGIREKAIAAVENVHWIPATGKNRMLGMLKTRKEWLLSRQRSWGVPIMWFMHKNSGDILILPAEEMEEITGKILDKLTTESYDFWYSTPAEELPLMFLPEGIAKDYVASRDIFDVWFESGMVHDYVGRQQDQNAVADIYIEGSDQHRGWFQSSLLTSVALYDEAPYKTVMTHGFVLDEKGEKMSKSLGNTQSMEECIGNFGNDVMRIWVLSSDFTEEIRFGTQSMERAKEIYKTIRNRLKFLLSVLNGQEQQQIQCESMPFLEKYIFARIFYLQQQINEKLHSYLYRDIFTTLMDFLNNDLSKIYFFSRKDTLYCDDKNSCHRKISIFTMGTILKFLLYNFSFMLPFMTEETWMVYNQEALEINRYKQESVHLMEPFIPTAICDHEAIIETMNKITKIGDEIMQKVEIAIKNQIVKSYNEAVIHLPTNDFAKDHKEIIKEVYKIADLIIHHNVEDIIVSKTTNKKCARCWNFVIDHSHSNELCDRCEKVLNRNISQ